MDYCQTQLEAFCTKAEADELPVSAQVVYIHLLNINARLHYCEWFSVANSTLENLTRLKSNKTIVSAKNRLKQAGLIDFKSDGKKTTRYSLITHASTQDSTHASTQDSTQDSTHVSTHIEEDDDDERARVRAGEIFDFYENNIHVGMTPFEAEVLSQFLDEYGEEWVKHAMEIAATNHAHSVKYIQKVLMRWRESDSKTPWNDRKKDGAPVVTQEQKAEIAKRRAEQKAKYEAEQKARFEREYGNAPKGSFFARVAEREAILKAADSVGGGASESA